MLAHLRAGEDVEPATDSFDQASPLHATKAFPGDPMGIEVPWSEHTVPPNEILDLLALRLAHGLKCDTERRRIIKDPDFSSQTLGRLIVEIGAAVWLLRDGHRATWVEPLLLRDRRGIRKA